MLHSKFKVNPEYVRPCLKRKRKGNERLCGSMRVLEFQYKNGIHEFFGYFCTIWCACVHTAHHQVIALNLLKEIAVAGYLYMLGGSLGVLVTSSLPHCGHLGR